MSTKRETVTIPQALAFAAELDVQAASLRLKAAELDRMATLWRSAIQAFGIGANVVPMRVQGSAGR